MLPVDAKKTIYVVDGYGFVFRAFYAVPNLTTQTGEPIGAVFGFFKMIISLINSARPEYLVVALDTGKRTFRNEIYDNFIENQAIDELFNATDCVESFKKVNLTKDDVKNKTNKELADILNIDKDKLSLFCESYGVNKDNPPKVLMLLLFLELTDNVKVEDYKTQYKANRAPTPDALKSQFKIIRELIEAMGLYKESSVGFEADDVIGSIASEAVKKGFRVVVVSADKDLCQLVKDGEIAVYDPSKKKYLDEKGVIEKFGIEAQQIVDYLSIIGDNSDNVIGVNGIGPKGAVKLLHEYNHIEDILNNIDKLDNATKTKINNSKDWLMLAQQLITLKHDAIKINDIDEYRTHINHQKLASFMDKYGFRNLDKEIRNQGFLKNNNKKTDENTTQAQQQHSMFEQNNNNNTNTPRIKTTQDDKDKDKKTDDTIKENTIITIKTTLFG